MAKPSVKAPALDELLKLAFGVDRVSSIEHDVCVAKPIGCGGPATEFRDALSTKEYTISGLCQKCQDRIFGGSDG